MSDIAYYVVWQVCVPAFWTSSKPVLLNLDVLRRKGAYILAPNHLSPFDVSCLMAVSPRNLDWVSIVEAFRNPLVALLYGSVNAFPLDRSRPDSPTVRIILDRLKRGRAVAMFPEGSIRKWENSVLNGGNFKPGIGRIAQLAGAPVIPCAIVGTDAYYRFKSWFPLRRVRYGAAFGEPIRVRTDLEKHEAVKVFLEDLKKAYLDLHEKLKAAMAPPAK
jgi:1-acyl-sn-glycerol-3-phosphate acyltransferase